MSDDLRSLRELIAALPVEQRAAFLAGLPVDVLAAATYEWAFWARTDQLEPSGPWLTWLMRSGRGAGKTRAGAEWVRAKAESGTYGLFNLVGRTDGDVRGTMVEGPSGLLTISPPHLRPIYRRGCTSSSGATVPRPFCSRPRNPTACAARSVRRPGVMSWPAGSTPRPTRTCASVCAWGATRAV